MGVSEVHVMVNYYVRLGYGHHIQCYCSHLLLEHPCELPLLFWHAYGLMLEGSYAEALHELKSLEVHQELEFAVLTAILHLHDHCGIAVDHETHTSLQHRIKISKQNASEKALVVAATLYWHLGGPKNLQKSRKLILRALKVQPLNCQAQCLYGWLLLAGSRVQVRPVDCHHPDDWKDAEAALRIFEDILTVGSNVEALLGRAYYFELKQSYVESLADLSQVIVLHTWFMPALVEKARIAMLLQDWELIQENLQFILHKDPNNIDGLRMAIHLLLCTKNKPTKVASLLKDLLKSIELREPRNAYLCFEVVRSCARLAGRGVSVLHKTQAFIERAKWLKPQEPAFTLEMAHQQFLLGDYKAAFGNYRLTTRMDELNMEATYGAIQCKLVFGDLDEVEQQLEFLTEMSVSTGKSASLPYLMAQLCWRKQGDRIQCCNLLDECIHIKSNSMSNQYDYNFYAELNPDVQLGIVHLYIAISLDECKGPHIEKSYSLLRAVDLLEQLIALIPGLIVAHLMLARALIQLDEPEKAQQSLQSVLALDPESSSAHLCSAQIFVDQGKDDMASQSLEQALSANFLVQELVVYHVLQAQIMVKSLHFDKAQKILEATRTLPEMRQGSMEPRSLYYTSKKNEEITTDAHRVMVFVLLAEVHMQLNHFSEASKTLQDAMHEFLGSPEEVKLIISSSDLALRQGNISTAIEILNQVPPKSTYYVQTRVALANVYLKYQHDKALYSSCYMELALLLPTSKTYMMLGESLMRIGEPEEAMKAYTAASKENPQDAMVAYEVGRALVMTHEYTKAVEHYENALRKVEGPDKIEVQYDLGELFFNLKCFKQASDVLGEVLACITEDNVTKSTKTFMLWLKASFLLHKVQNIQGDHASSIEVMLRARQVAKNYFMGFQGQASKSHNQRHTTAHIFFQFSQECEAHNDMESAITMLYEVLKCNPTHNEASLALAKIHLSRGEINECEQQCTLLLRADPANADAADFLVNLMIYREHYDAAILHIEQILEHNPNQYTALSQLIHLFHRAGRLDEVNHYLNQAEKATPLAPFHAGLNYCKGLFARHSNKPYEAIMLMNNARADLDWGKPAVFAMVELYLNVDELGWEDTNSEAATFASGEAVKIAHKLLTENRKLEGESVKQIVLECYTAMATRHKNDIERALDRLQELERGQQETKLDRVSNMLAIATGLILLRQAPKAKNQLQVINRMAYKWDSGDNFERTWLMLANIHAQAGKQEAAEELCQKCLKYNKECHKAWELLGVIMEKNHSYPEAVTFYENAWKCQKEASPTIGYRLAFTYLKDKRHIEAISVCQKVLRLSPNYPKIKKEVLDKARVCVRA